MRRMSTVNATRVRGEAPGRGLGAAGSGRRATAWNPEVLPQGPLPSVSLPLPPGKAREPSACGPGNPCPLGPWTSTSSGRPRGGCSRAWSAAGRDRWARGPVPTSPRCAGTCSVVSPPRPPPLLFAYPATSCSPTRWAPCQRPAHAPFSPPPRPPPRASTAACQPLRPLPCSARPDASPLWLQWLPQPQLRVRPRRRRRPQPRRAPAPPILRAARVSLHQWGGCGPRCCLRAEALVALGPAPRAHWAPQQDWHWARRYGLPYVVRVDLSRVAPAPPAAPAPARTPGPAPIPKQALAFTPFSPPKRLRLVVSHGSIDLDVNSDGP